MKPLIVMAEGAVMIVSDAPVAIHLDQLGYLPGTAKRGIDAGAALDPLPWRLIGADGVVAARGKTTPVGDDAASGDRVQRVDFGSIHRSGQYRLDVTGTTSPAFLARVRKSSPRRTAFWPRRHARAIISPMRPPIIRGERTATSSTAVSSSRSRSASPVGSAIATASSVRSITCCGATRSGRAM